MFDDDTRQELRQLIFGSAYEAASFFYSDVDTAFNSVANETLADDLAPLLIEHMLGVAQIDDQPLEADLISDLNSLRDILVTDCPTCNARRTASIVKGMCTAVLASAPIMIH